MHEIIVAPLDGNSFTLQVTPCDSILGIKARLSEKTGVNVADFALVCQGKFLEDILEYGSGCFDLGVVMVPMQGLTLDAQGYVEFWEQCHGDDADETLQLPCESSARLREKLEMLARASPIITGHILKERPSDIQNAKGRKHDVYRPGILVSVRRETLGETEPTPSSNRSAS